MKYYVIQVKTGGEEKFLKLARQVIDNPELQNPIDLVWPRRRLKIRRKGKTADALAPIFPGYVFLESESIEPIVFWGLRRTPGFFRFLKSNHSIEPLSGKDREMLLHFLSFGEIVEKSTVIFDENERIRVREGALKGMEGRIIKVDKRKRRAKISLSLYDDSFQIDFGFEVIEPVERHEPKEE
ncbi:MAG: antiterminator LoaP [Spirochaetales bacterium]|jgi:transcription termination/antitermination protein NusG|nr:antiterminator LoaP [Spirochaetales bacterium]